MSTIPKESQDDLWNEVYRDFQDIFDYRQSTKQRDKWFEDVKREYFVQRNDQLATDGREEDENAKLGIIYWKGKHNEASERCGELKQQCTEKEKEIKAMVMFNENAKAKIEELKAENERLKFELSKAQKNWM